jgi:hypothetical protein
MKTEENDGMKRKKECLLRKIGEMYMIVPVENKQILLDRIVLINETGAYLWDLLEREMTKEEMLDAMQSEYSIDREVAEDDLTEFLKKMQAAGLLEDCCEGYR